MVTNIVLKCNINYGSAVQINLIQVGIMPLIYFVTLYKLKCVWRIYKTKGQVWSYLKKKKIS